MVGEWRVTAYLARGGSSEVYCARHARLGTAAVLKVLRREGEAPRARFDRETAFLMENHHPAFPSFYGAGEEDGRPWMAMEVLEECPLPSKDGEVAGYLEDVARGVAALHARGWLHRDVKPGNILRRGDGHAVLVDFGLLKPIGRGNEPDLETLSVVDGREVGVGTPGFAAPEQFSGGRATEATDVHALGMLAELCFGGHPPREWEPIVRTATATLPRLRYPTVEAFLQAVENRHAAPGDDAGEENDGEEEEDGGGVDVMEALARMDGPPPWERVKWRLPVGLAAGLAAAAALALAFWCIGRGFEAALAETGRIAPWCWWHLKFVVGPSLLAVMVLATAYLLEESGGRGERVVSPERYDSHVAPTAWVPMVLVVCVVVEGTVYAVCHAFGVLGLSFRAIGLALLFLAEIPVVGLAGLIAFLLFHGKLWNRFPVTG